jgi:hypothetical protein
MKKFFRFDLLSICLIVSCISFGISLTYLFISENASRERMTFFLIAIVAFVSCMTFLLLIRDARRQEEDKGKG